MREELFSKKFLSLRKQVSDLEKKLAEKQKALSKVCPHRFPPGLSFTDCEYCSMSSYYEGREDQQ